MDVNLSACVAGDKQAWDRFVEETSAVVYASVRRTIRRHTTAEFGEVDDAVQEVYLKLYRNDSRLLRGFDPTRSALSTWLTLVARSVAIDHLRRRKHQPRALDEQTHAPAAPAPSPEEPERIEVPLHLLTARQRLVLRMIFDEDMTPVEAAHTMGVDVQTIRSTKHKALSRLRDALAPPSA